MADNFDARAVNQNFGSLSGERAFNNTLDEVSMKVASKAVGRLLNESLQGANKEQDLLQSAAKNAKLPLSDNSDGGLSRLDLFSMQRAPGQKGLLDTFNERQSDWTQKGAMAGLLVGAAGCASGVIKPWAFSEEPHLRVVALGLAGCASIGAAVGGTSHGFAYGSAPSDVPDPFAERQSAWTQRGLIAGLSVGTSMTALDFWGRRCWAVSNPSYIHF